MSKPGAAAEELIAFEGAVECRMQQAAIGLQLRGSAPAVAARASITEALFAGVAGLAAAPPTQLHEVRVLRMSPQSYCIQAREGRFALQARSVQLHGETATAFFRSVPPPAVPLATRLSWSLLLAALRLPGVARLLGPRKETP